MKIASLLTKTVHNVITKVLMKKFTCLFVCLAFVFLTAAHLRAEDISPVDMREHIGKPRSVVSPDGTKIAVLSERYPAALIGDVNTGKLLRTLRGPTIEESSTGESIYHFNAVVFSPDGKKILAMGSPDGWGWAVSPEMWRDMNARERMAQNRMSREMNRKIQLAETEANARIWDIDTGRGFALRGHGGDGVADTTHFSSDGKRVVSTNGNVIQTWDANTGRLLQTSRKTNTDTLLPDAK